MNHEEAVRSMAAERYLLGELSPELREQFEGHFFDCAECASDLRAGSTFVQHSEVLLASEAAVAQHHPQTIATKKRGWLAWLQPAVAAPALALLLAVFAYQNWPTPREAQVLQPVFVNVGSRGGSPATVSVHEGQGFLLRVEVPPTGNDPSYRAEIYAPGGQLQYSVSLPVAPDADNYFIQVPAGHHQSGVYSVVIRGTAANTVSNELGRSTFELQILK